MDFFRGARYARQPTRGAVLAGGGTAAIVLLEHDARSLFHLEGKQFFRVRREGGDLVLRHAGGPEMRLDAESEMDLRVAGGPVEVLSAGRGGLRPAGWKACLEWPYE